MLAAAFVSPAAVSADGGQAILPRPDAYSQKMAVGGGHTCQIVPSGYVSCWGRNDFGQLGRANTEPLGDNEKAGAVNTTLPKMVAITAGLLHTCGITQRGGVLCWGSNGYGQLGLGNVTTIGDDEVPSALTPLPLGETAVQITAGNHHTCAKLVSSRVTCWGRGANGRLGYGNANNIGDNETPAANPVDLGFVAVGAEVLSVQAGGGHTCALTVVATVKCWGIGSDGQLGYGNTNDIGDNEKPNQNPVNQGVVSLPGAAPAVALAVGGAHTCAVLFNRTVTCWGLGALGQLGYGTTTSIGDDEKPSQNPVDGGIVSLPAGLAAESVSAGLNYTCALAASGAASCWGNASVGQLGYGNVSRIGDDEKPSANPVDNGFIAFPPTNIVRALVAGDEHVCALRQSGSVTCWGNGQHGALGYGNVNRIGDNEKASANPVDGALVRNGDESAAVAVAAGEGISCALRVNGEVACWGTGGALGYGNNATIGDNESITDTPMNGGVVPMPYGEAVTQVVAGTRFACALLISARVTCWGQNDVGQLGYGNTNPIGDDETPADNPVDFGIVQMPFNGRVKQISAGNRHACALLLDTRVVCWGSGGEGRLGYGNTNTIGDDEKPNQNPVNNGWVPTPGMGPLSQVAAGGSHTCAVSILGWITCWGFNGSGQLGYGNTNTIGDNETPAQNPVDGGIFALKGFRQASGVSAGERHTCARTPQHEVICWGDAAGGALGYANPIDIGDDERPGGPVRLPAGMGPIADLESGFERTCVRSRGGRVACWGNGAFGALGYGNSNSIGDNEAPAQNPVNGGYVPNVLFASHLSTGRDHSCSVTAGALVSCWGLGLNGQLGRGATQNIGDDEMVPAGLVLPGVTRLADVVPRTGRLLDTRATGNTIDGVGAGIGVRAAGSTTEVPITRRFAGLEGVLFSVAVVQPSANGFLTLYPCGQARPQAASMTYVVGGATTNTVYTRPGKNGAVCVYTSAATHVVVDVQSATPNGSSWAAISPARLMDTRPTGVTVDGQYQQGGVLASNSHSVVEVNGRSLSGVPSTARFVLLNVTTVGGTGPGYVVVRHCGDGGSFNPSVVFSTNTAVSNLVLVEPQGVNVCLFTSATTHLVIDVVGYVDGTPAVHGGSTASMRPSVHAASSLRPFRPAEAVDVFGQLAAGTTRAFDIRQGGVAGSAPRYVVVNVTALLPTANGHIRLYPCVPLANTLPPIAQLTYKAGLTRSATAVVEVGFAGQICAYTSAATGMELMIEGYTM
jgi:alpha-tubulin suppressor-like RCC1 family protein